MRKCADGVYIPADITGDKSPYCSACVTSPLGLLRRTRRPSAERRYRPEPDRDAAEFMSLPPGERLATLGEGD